MRVAEQRRRHGVFVGCVHLRRVVEDHRHRCRQQPQLAVAQGAGQARLAQRGRIFGAAEGLGLRAQPLLQIGPVGSGRRRRRKGLDRQRPAAVPEGVEAARSLGHRRAGDQPVEVGEIDLAAGVEIFVAQVATADHRHRVVGDPQLVVHAPVQALRVAEVFEHMQQAEGASAGEGVEDAHLDMGEARQRGQVEVLALRVEVVDQQPHAHAALRRAQHARQQQLRAGVVAHDVVLQIQRVQGRLGQAHACGEGVDAGRQRMQARQPRLRRQLRGIGPAQRAVLRCGPGGRHRSRHIEGQAAAGLQQRQAHQQRERSHSPQRQGEDGAGRAHGLRAGPAGRIMPRTGTH